MKDLREAVLQALAFTMRDFATVRDFEAARAKLRDSLRVALDSDTGETTMHSTGPWTAMVTDTMGDTPALWDIVQRSSGGTVAEIQSHNSDDAALVAAAPDLLAALQHMVEMYQRYFNVMPVAWQTADDIACAAIARATGGQ